MLSLKSKLFMVVIFPLIAGITVLLTVNVILTQQELDLMFLFTISEVLDKSMINTRLLVMITYHYFFKADLQLLKITFKQLNH